MSRLETLAIVIALAVVTSCASSPDNAGVSELPDFVQTENGTLIISLDEATDSRADWHDSMQGLIKYDLGECAATFGLGAVGDESATAFQPVLDDPRVSLSDRIDSTDDIAQVMMVPVVDAETHSVDVHIFIDSQWADIVSGDTSLYVSRIGEILELPEPVPVNVSGDSVFYRKITALEPGELSDFFSGVPNGCALPVNIYITNIAGTYRDVAVKSQGFRMDPGEVAIRFRGIF